MKLFNSSGPQMVKTSYLGQQVVKSMFMILKATIV